MSGKLTAAVQAYTCARGPKCGVGLLRVALDKDTQAELDTLLADESVPSTAIAKGLGDIGRPIRAEAVQRHRRGSCNCAK